MPRPRNGLNRQIPISYNTATNFYEAVEQRITYRLTFKQFNELKTFYSKGLFVATDEILLTWYNSLNKADRKAIVRINAPDTGDRFYPDPEYN